MKLGVLRRLRLFFLVPSSANSVQGPYLPLYGVLFACLG
ncbi:hypothetical protein E2C01_027166 [Portunus trituberculatus]|uniref:Uncharacterized protein n=1 Tax=Portunus trituberculatus TaxID=210409 RepID=A0A5B7EI20_PORTR|nr:hypothetical protein [Portunus trituberculatus]